MKKYELTEMQTYFYGGHKLGLGQACLLCGSALVKGKRDIAELQHAANEVVRINDSLRTRFVEENGRPMQMFIPFEEQEFDVLRFDSAEELDAFGEVWGQEVIELDGPLFELRLVELPDSYGAVLKMHHIVSDAWTMMLIGDQFFRILNGETPEAYSYAEHIESEAAFKDTKRFEKGKEFFREQKERLPERTLLSKKPLTSKKGKCIEYEFSDEESRQIRDYVKQHRTSPYDVFATAAAVWMSRELKRDMFYIGSVVLNRTGYRGKNSTGMYVNSTPIILECDHDASFADNIRSVSKSLISSLRHERSGATEFGLRQMPYDIWISYEAARLESVPDARCEMYYCGAHGYVMIFTLVDRGTGNLSIRFGYNVKYPDKKAEKMLNEVPLILVEGIRDDSLTPEELLARMEEGTKCSKKSKKSFRSILKNQ